MYYHQVGRRYIISYTRRLPIRETTATFSDCRALAEDAIPNVGTLLCREINEYKIFKSTWDLNSFHDLSKHGKNYICVLLK